MAFLGLPPPDLIDSIRFVPPRRSILGGRSTVGHVALNHVIGVRIPASQPDSNRVWCCVDRLNSPYPCLGKDKHQAAQAQSASADAQLAFALKHRHGRLCERCAEKGAEPQRSELRIVPAARTTAPWAELAVCAHGPNTVEAWTHRPTVGMPDRCILRESMRPVRAPVSALEATARLLRSDQPARRQDRLFWAPLAAPDRSASCSIMSVFRLDCRC